MYFLGYNAKNKNLNLAKQYITNNWFDPVGYFATGWSDCQNTDYKACYEIMVAFVPKQACLCPKGWCQFSMLWSNL